MPDTLDELALPLHERPEVRSRRWFLLGVMCLSLVLVVMSAASLNVAVPTIQLDLGASPSAIQWILDSYVLVFAGLLLAAGAIGDRYGRREALLGGLLVFGAGSLVAGLADDAATVIVGRVIQGVGAAFVMPATLSIITAVFPPHERGKAIAIWVGFASAGASIGSVVSGALLEWFWWGSTILVNVPVVVVVAAAIWRFGPRSKDETATPLDPLGAVLSLAAAVSLLYGIIEGPERGWTDGVVLGAFAVAAVAGAAFVWWERRTPHPMLPVDLFRDIRFSLGSSVVMLTFFVMMGFWFLSTQYFQFARGYSALEAGLAGLPGAFAIGITSARNDGITARIGAYRTMSTGFVILAAGFVGLVTVRTDSPLLWVIAITVVIGFGAGLTMAPATTSIMSAVPWHRAGIGSAVNDVSREFGMALGIAVFGTIVNSTYRSRLEIGDGTLPDEVVHAAEDSVAAATSIAREMGDAGSGVLDDATHAFTDAFNVAMAAAAAVAVATALVVVALGRRAVEPGAAGSPEAAAAAAALRSDTSLDS